MSDINKLFNELPDDEQKYTDLIKERFGISELNILNKSAVFGTENLGKKLLYKFRDLGIEISTFSDNNKNKWGNFIDGIPIIEPEELKNNPEQLVIIASKYVREIFAQLKSLGVKKVLPHYVLSVLFPEYFPNELHKKIIKDIYKDRRKIERVYNTLSESKSKELFLNILNFRISLWPEDLPLYSSNQYFPSFFPLEQEETYVDAGAFDGDTLRQFLNRQKGMFNKYIALEPDEQNYKKLLQSIPEIYKERIFTYPVGAGAIKSKAFFCNYGREDSMIADDGDNEIDIIPLDELLIDEKVTTIKIDVEGYEPQVLEGAKKIIKEKKPKLAVCVYHRPDHLWELPLQIISYNSNYKLYLRHYEPEIYGTVLYGI